MRIDQALRPAAQTQLGMAAMITVHLRHRNAATHSYKIVKIEGAVIVDARLTNFRTGDLMSEDEVKDFDPMRYKVICT